MSEKQGTSKGLVLLGVVLFLVPFWVLRQMDLPLWATMLWLGIVIAACLAFGWWARHAPRHERFALEDEWESGLPAAQALERITDHFRAEGATVRQQGKEVIVEVGSDFKFRFSGIETARGRRAFPSTLTLTAIDTGSGSTVKARSRDNLGWYAKMHSWIPQWADERNAHLIDSTRHLTGAATDRPHLDTIKDRPSDNSFRPENAMNWSSAVIVWGCWVVLTVFVVIDGETLQDFYWLFTAAVALFTALLFWSRRRRDRSWSQRVQKM
ncbi:SGNH/GDSL hydrolase family protein [Kocuria sp. CPCC 205292]|uniref:SGNH/GDSL hydrolase family protein n=1 Tax=Kocuria cellulosilytica TaxID=3071451 RepID=UPI0034D54A87